MIKTYLISQTCPRGLPEVPGLDRSEALVLDLLLLTEEVLMLLIHLIHPRPSAGQIGGRDRIGCIARITGNILI